MKINVRLLLINFVIVLVVTLTSTAVYYSVTNSFFKNQNSKIILKSANDFIFAIQSEISKVDESFSAFVNKNENPTKTNFENTAKPEFDFLFKTANDTLILKNSLRVFNNQIINTDCQTVSEFIHKNPNIILRNSKVGNQKYYYGKSISTDFLDNLEKTIDAKISFTVDNIPFALPSEKSDNKYLYQIIKAINNLKFKNNYDLFSETLSDVDFFSTYYEPSPSLATNLKQGFLIYRTPKEGIEYASTMKLMMVIIIFAGLALSVVFILLFTGKFRKQIFILSETAKEASKGNFKKRIPILTKDEIGQFAESFNGMLNELEKKNEEEKEYTEFLALLNQNPELKEISETALSKILHAGNFSVGAMYLVQDEDIRCITYFGVDKTFANAVEGNDLYKEAIKKKEFIEYYFKDNFPIIKSGLAEIQLKYLLIFPILFNNEVIAIIELASQTEPETNIKAYLERIRNQLAIGLVNAKSLEQLENIVDELRELNDNYHKKNDQIKKQNVELLRLHDELKLQAKELEKQKDKAVALAKVKSQFLASMSHELRTPLNSILGLTELAFNDRETTSKTKERLNIVIRNSKKLLTLINNILEFSKADSGKIEVIEKEFLLSDFLCDLQSFITPLVIEKGLEFFVETIPEKDILLKTDKNKLDQILTNLLGNSIKFTDNGYIKLALEESENNRIIFKIIDTGIGISQDERKKIFEEFQQIESGNNRKYGGTGLGLAICKRYIELLNGKLELDSNIGEGSLFSVYLPNIIKERINFDRKKDATISAKLNGKKLLSVLIISSNFEIQKIFEDYLSNYYVKTSFADNTDDGFQFAVELKPDYIILDLFLNGNTGIDLLLRLKASKSTSQIHNILTAFNTEDKLGIGFLINGFFINNISEENLDALIEEQSKSVHKIKNITVIQDKHLSLPIKTKYNVIYSENNYKYAVEIFEKQTPDLIIFNVNKTYRQEFSMLFDIHSNKYLKNIPVCFSFPEQIDSGTRNSIIEDVKSIIQKGNFHRYDVLKIIRKRLGLQDNSITKKKLLTDESEVQEDEGSTYGKIKREADMINVLIVDDDADTLFTVGEIVEDLGFKTEFAHNGVECLLSINSNIPDIILLDIMMPQMDGFETIKRIRKNENTKHLPVIALTAHAMLDDKEIIEKNGFNGLITKPINRAELAFKVKRIFKLET